MCTIDAITMESYAPGLFHPCMPLFAKSNSLGKYILLLKFSFGAKFLKLVQFLFSFVMYSLP